MKKHILSLLLFLSLFVCESHSQVYHSVATIINGQPPTWPSSGIQGAFSFNVSQISDTDLSGDYVGDSIYILQSSGVFTRGVITTSELVADDELTLEGVVLAGNQIPDIGQQCIIITPGARPPYMGLADPALAQAFYRYWQPNIEKAYMSKSQIATADIANGAVTGSKITPPGVSKSLMFSQGGAATGSHRLTYDSSNVRLGIGIQAPAVGLHLNTVAFGITNATTGATATDGGFMDLSSSVLRFGNRENANLEFHTNNTARLYLTAAGALGIGTASPQGSFANTGNNTVDGAGTGTGTSGNFTWSTGSSSYPAAFGNSTNGSSTNHVLLLRTLASVKAARVLNCTAGGSSLSTSTGSNDIFAVCGDGTAISSSGAFSTQGDAQVEQVQLRRAITGTAQTELFVNGSSLRFPIASSRAFHVKVTFVASVKTVGNGSGISVGDSYTTEVEGLLKNVGGTTSLVGSVTTILTPIADTGMSTSAISVAADDTNDAVAIKYTPPSTAGSTTVIQVVARVVSTETSF